MCLGMPGRVVEIVDAGLQRVRVDVGGELQVVSVAMIGLDGDGGVRVDDWVVVHLGLAMSRIDEDEAKLMVDSLQELHDLYERELSIVAQPQVRDVVNEIR